MTKWSDQPHWEYDATFLGSDAHGDWIGIAAGTPMARPGMSFHAEVDQVALFPGPTAGAGGWWAAVFHSPGFRLQTYVDMATPAVWSGACLTAVDLDLDVVEEHDGHVFVDDEDEFAVHQVAYGYPAEVIARAEASCAWVHRAVVDRQAPFDGSHLSWLARVTELRTRPRTGPA